MTFIVRSAGNVYLYQKQCKNKGKRPASIFLTPTLSYDLDFTWTTYFSVYYHNPSLKPHISIVYELILVLVHWYVRFSRFFDSTILAEYPAGGLLTQRFHDYIMSY